MEHFFLLTRASVKVLAYQFGNLFLSDSKPERKLVTISETYREEDIIYKEERIVDNSRSKSKITRKFTFSNEITTTYSILFEKSNFNGVDLNIGINLPQSELASITATSQETLKELYSISKNSKQSREEEIIVEVEPLTKKTLIIIWKQVLQNGYIKIIDENNSELNIPFKVVVGLTFDQSSIDETN